MANHEDIYIDQGAAFTAEITVQKDGQDFDLSSYNYSGQIRKTLNSAAATTSFTIVQNSDSDRTNVLDISLTHTQTSLLTAARYVYDIEATESDSDGADSDSLDIYRVIQGTIHVSKNVTR